jgi:hypothetical protein
MVASRRSLPSPSTAPWNRSVDNPDMILLPDLKYFFAVGVGHLFPLPF